MDTRRLKRKIKRFRRRLFDAPRTAYVRLLDRIRENRAADRRARGLEGQPVTLLIEKSEHAAQIRNRKNG